MHRPDFFLKATLLAIAVLLAISLLRPYLWPDVSILADAGRFDYVYVISPLFLYKGHQGVLLLDKRNGDVWFIAQTGDGSGNTSFKDPAFVVRLPLEKLDQAPH